MKNVPWRHYLHAIRTNAITFIKWMGFSLPVGLLTGLMGAAFRYALEWANTARTGHGWLIFLLPAAGLAIVGLYQLCGMAEDRGTEYVLVSVREGHAMRLRTAPLIFAGTVLTHLTGGSAGREGAALQMGGSLAGGLCRLLHLNDKDERILTMCGMAGGFSALFGTPLAAAVFAMEVESIGVMYYAALVPCITSALTAQFVAGMLGAVPTSFVLSGAPTLAPLPFFQVIGLGILCAVLANLFCQAMSRAGYLYRKWLPNRYVRAAAGGCLVVVLTLLEGSGDYNGAGSAVIAAAVSGHAVPYAFALKIIFTALTLGAGFKGGEIVPVLFTGATFGCTMAPLLGLDPSFGAALGMTAVFCGVTNSPMTSILLGFELFGGAGLPLLAAGCAVSYMLSGYSGLYREQKIMYSKTGPTFINLKSGAHNHTEDGDD